MAEAQERAQKHTPDLRREGTRQVDQQAVTYARDRSFEREAVSDERDLYRDALRRGMSETTYAEVRAGFEARIASGEFQLVSGQKYDSGRQFTTAETSSTRRAGNPSPDATGTGPRRTDHVDSGCRCPYRETATSQYRTEGRCRGDSDLSRCRSRVGGKSWGR